MSWLALMLLVGGFLAGCRRKQGWADLFGPELFVVGLVAFGLLALFGNSLTALLWAFGVLAAYLAGRALIWAIGFALGRWARPPRED
jgi:hypothetical protein